VSGKFKKGAVSSLAAAKTGASFVGKKAVELDKDTGYIDKARKRLAKAREVTPQEREMYLETAGSILGVATLWLPGDSKYYKAAAMGATGVRAGQYAGYFSDDHRDGTLTHEKAGMHAAGLAVDTAGGKKTKAVRCARVCFYVWWW
jgi:hypothetical protein